MGILWQLHINFSHCIFIHPLAENFPIFGMVKLHLEKRNANTVPQWSSSAYTGLTFSYFQKHLVQSRMTANDLPVFFQLSSIDFFISSCSCFFLLTCSFYNRYATWFFHHILAARSELFSVFTFSHSHLLLSLIHIRSSKLAKKKEKSL